MYVQSFFMDQSTYLLKVFGPTFICGLGEVVFAGDPGTNNIVLFLHLAVPIRSFTYISFTELITALRRSLNM